MRKLVGTIVYRFIQIILFPFAAAGFDTRAYRLPADARVRCFEIDAPKTQAFKRQMLKNAGVDSTRVTYVPADFQHEDWFAQLVHAGFEPSKPTLFTWESVPHRRIRAPVARRSRR